MHAHTQIFNYPLCHPSTEGQPQFGLGELKRGGCSASTAPGARGGGVTSSALPDSTLPSVLPPG